MRDYSHKNFNKDFGITDSQLKNVRDKLLFQKEFCENTFCSVYEDGTFLTLLDITFNPNLNSRYASMTQNRVDTLTKSAKHDNLVPVFLTATLDGFFRDFLRGDYSRYTPEIEEKYKHKIPNNERYGYIRDKIARKEPLTIRDLYKVLLFQFTERFLGSRKMRKIKIEGQKRHYFRAFEPHKKDGVPHLHCLLYIPKDYLAASYQSFIAAFPAPQNHKKLSRRRIRGKIVTAKVVYVGSNRKKHYETNGFQTHVEDVKAYIMKYIFKTFKNSNSDKEITKLEAWYIINKIPRLTTSRSILPYWIYHQAIIFASMPMYKHLKNWSYLNQIWKYPTEHRKIVSDYKTKSFVIYDNGTKYTYNNGYFQIDDRFSEEMQKACAESGGKDSVNFFAEYGETKDKPQYNKEQLKKEYARKSRVKGKDRELDYIPVDIDGDERYLLKPFGKLVKPPIKSITSRYGKGRLSDQQLLHDYQTFDIETGNLQRYASMKKELINRGLLPYEEVNINDYGGNGLDINVK